MTDIISIDDLPEDLQGEPLIDAMIAGANAKAARVAPCLTSDDPAPTEGQLAEAKLILLGAITRWASTGSGGVTTTQQTAGPFGQMTVTDSTRTGFKLWPTEIGELQAICAGGSTERSAFSIDTAPPAPGGTHVPWCSSQMGATYCSCGADIAGTAIYEGD